MSLVCRQTLVTTVVYVVLVLTFSSPIGASFILLLFAVVFVWMLRTNLHALGLFSPTADEVRLRKSTKAILTQYAVLLFLLIAVFVVVCGIPFMISKIQLADLNQLRALPFVFLGLMIFGILIASSSAPEFADVLYIFVKGNADKAQKPSRVGNRHAQVKHTNRWKGKKW